MKDNIYNTIVIDILESDKGNKIIKKLNLNLISKKTI